MANPVRIYVLHHPESWSANSLVASLTNQIYDWFRTSNLEGIPVYVRSLPAPGEVEPELPARKQDEPCLEYLVPLVDANLVRDPVWHGYLAKLASQCGTAEPGSAADWGWVMFPVALDSTAFNLPDVVTRMNFIRYGTRPIPRPALPDQPTEAEQAELAAYRASEAEELLKHLTEALARDLSARVFARQQSERFKIFISYARADSTSEAKALRNYIQSQTQCVVFFDENDIGYGQAVGASLAENVSVCSHALIVLNSDHYAERPWCRWEIDRFTQDREVSLAGKNAKCGPYIHVFHPVLVVDNLKGPKMTRMVPELGQASGVRWEPGRERMCFNALMREVVLGLRDVLDARSQPWGDLSEAIVVNRLPGPVALMRLLPPDAIEAREKPFTVYHPGHGLPLTELRLLERTFPRVRFKAFRDITSHLPKALTDALDALERDRRAEPPLRHQVIALSTAHNLKELAAIGYLPQHQDEALIHLLRPLVRLGADLMYGGWPPRRDMEFLAATTGTADRNITLTLMQLLSNERSVAEQDPSANLAAAPPAQSGPLLFNISTWPSCTRISAKDEAAWISVCRVHKVLPKDAKLAEWTGPVPGEADPSPPHFRRYLALVFSRMRELLAEGFRCRVPGNLDRQVRPAAFVFIGGAIERFKGVMPGVMEEFLNAARARPAIPLYLVGGLGGATGVLARSLLHPTPGPTRELTHAFYLDARAPNGAEYRTLMSELNAKELARVRDNFRRLWSIIRAHHGRNGLNNLFGNGLTDAENRSLLGTTDAIKAVSLIWTGMGQVLLGEGKPTSRSQRGVTRRIPKQSRHR